ncbi:uncharacterized protein LOC116805000 [Drosophila grimshawi]|uniref:uncharacterized protein LOC116805000 n=1 Tax=Drosophila grimshawi TaxID=7222 RepID=UPI000C86F516|nr:uncharacterized protein LOC116805000 [Drosophila grimshawi]XP_043072385.1 uncharacterized protein LOC116805000 [Drosophila grimshawi]
MPKNQWLNGYFAKLNPVAEKIAFDMSEVISAYDHVWLTLTTAQQDNILNDTIIKPEITIRYYSSSHAGKEIAPNSSVESTRKKGTKCQKHNIIYAFDRLNLRTFIHQSIGLKIVHDENIGDYRDEHSFPFSYKTKSQINLAALESDSDSNNDITAIQLSTKILPPIPRKDTNESDHQKQIIPFRDVEPKRIDIVKCTESSINSVAADEKLNLLSNFGSKNTLLSISTDSNDFDNDTKEQHSEKCKLLPDSLEMPKGFDFLSNW